MKKIIHYILGTLAAVSIVALSASAQTVFTPRQISHPTSTPIKGQLYVVSSTNQTVRLDVGSNGKCLTASSTATYGVSWETCASTSGSSTTTINGVTGPTFTFNVSGNNGLAYSSSTGILTVTQATSTDSVSGFLSAADHAIFNAKVGGSGTSTQVAVFSASSTVTSYTGLAFNNASGTLTITGPAGTSTLTIGTSTKPACQQSRDSDDAGWTKSYWKGGILFVENTTCQ